MDVLSIPGKVLLREFKIKFEYITKRGNLRTRIVKIKAADKENAEFWFYQWCKNQNETKYSFTAYSNEKILECVEIGRELINV